jgi:hypothetical protein
LLADPGASLGSDPYLFRAYPNPQASPSAAPGAPKLSFGANLKQWIESLAPNGKRLSGTPAGKMIFEQCEAIRAQAIKCLREAEAKEQWSNVCKPHVDRYVKHCKHSRRRMNWVNPADHRVEIALPI